MLLWRLVKMRCPLAYVSDPSMILLEGLLWGNLGLRLALSQGYRPRRLGMHHYPGVQRPTAKLTMRRSRSIGSFVSLCVYGFPFFSFFLSLWCSVIPLFAMCSTSSEWVTVAYLEETELSGRSWLCVYVFTVALGRCDNTRKNPDLQAKSSGRERVDSPMKLSWDLGRRVRSEHVTSALTSCTSNPACQILTYISS